MTCNNVDSSARPAVSRLARLALAAALLALGSGCGGGLSNLYSDDAVRAKANTLAQRVGEYGDQQRLRIERINEDYRVTSIRLNRELAQLGRDELSQSFDLDALNFSDTLVDEFNSATLPGRFRDGIEKRVAAERARIDAIDAEIAAARNAYADTYKEATLELARLKRVKEKVEALAADENEDANLLTLIQKISAAYREVAQRQKEATTQPAKGASST